MSQLHVSLDSDKKSRWEEYADENPEFDNLSQLVRFSVEQEIQSDDDMSDIDVISDSQEQVLEMIEEIDRDIRALDNSVLTEDEFDEFRSEYDTALEPMIEFLIRDYMETQNQELRTIIKEQVDEALKEHNI